MVTRNPGRRAARAGWAGAALAALVAVLVSMVALSACGTATASGSQGPALDPGGHIIGLSASPTPTTTSIPPTHGPDHGVLVVIVRAGAPDVGLDVIRTPTPAGLVDLTTWARVERVISGSAVVGQELRVFQVVRQDIQLQGIPEPADVLPPLVSGRLYELWLRPFTVNAKAISGTWMIIRERPGVL